MPYLTFLFLFFANLLQTKLFCHLPFMSLPLSIKEKGSQHSTNTGLLIKEKGEKKDLIPSTVILKCFFLEQEWKGNVAYPHKHLVPLGSMAVKIHQKIFHWSSFLVFSATSPVPKCQALVTSASITHPCFLAPCY